MFTSMNKTEARQINPAVEHLHKEARELTSKERELEDDNRDLMRQLRQHEEIIESMENKLQ